MSNTQEMQGCTSEATGASHCRFCEFKSKCLGAVIDEGNQSADAPFVNFGRRLLKRDQHLYWTGDTLTHVYFVRSGSVKKVRTANGVDEQITGFVYPGESISSDAALQAAHARADAIAIQASTLCSVSITQLESLCAHRPAVRRALLDGVRVAILKLEARLCIGNTTAEQRIAAFILDFSERQPSRAAQIGFNLPMAHRDIGNFMSLTPETISRALTRMQQRKLLTVRGHTLSIKNLGGLQDLGASVARHKSGRSGREHDADAMTCSNTSRSSD